jgi:pimeloyl-ACP methyl ester carboxylesterase
MAEIVLIHGAWVTTASWDDFRRPFEQAGHVVHTPTWPLLDGKTAAEINAAAPAGFGSLTVGKIADHLEPQIPQGAILIGHSFGGLLTQMLLDRGAGRAGIAINPVPISGIIPGPTSIGAIVPIVTRWNGWNRPYAFTRDRWFRRFANGAARSQSDAAFDSFVIPAPGGIFYQAAMGIGTRIDPQRRTQPLLITGSSNDRLVTPHVSRSAYRIQRHSAARTDYLDLGSRSHFLLNEPGWEEIAERALGWISGLEMSEMLVSGARYPCRIAAL